MVPEPDEGRASDLLQRAIELSDLSEYATAAETAARAIELDPNNAFAHTVRAWALENLGEQHLDEARSVYETAIALDATAPWPRTGLADLLYRSGSREEAERLYRHVAEDAEPFDERLACLEFRGWSLYRLGRLDEAIRTFHTSIERLPGRISVLFDLALTLLANGQPDEADDAYETAFEAVIGRRPTAAARSSHRRCRGPGGGDLVAPADRRPPTDDDDPRASPSGTARARTTRRPAFRRTGIGLLT